MLKPSIYTVGHSTHSLDFFLELLNAYSVNCLIDVRSVAASSYNPQYNKEPLSNYLKSNGIDYKHFGIEFGARHTDPDLLDEENRVDFELVRKSWNFRNGIDQLMQLNNDGCSIALMCSESDPMECHRFSMISIELEKNELEVRHILKDKTIILNSELEKQLLKKFEKKLPYPDLFQPNITLEDQLKVAYRLHNKEVGYAPLPNQPVKENHD